MIGTVGDVQQPESTDEVDYISDMRTVTELFDLTKVDERDSGPSCSLAEALRKQDLFINSTSPAGQCVVMETPKHREHRLSRYVLES